MEQLSSYLPALPTLSSAPGGVTFDASQPLLPLNIPGGQQLEILKAQRQGESNPVYIKALDNAIGMLTGDNPVTGAASSDSGFNTGIVTPFGSLDSWLDIFGKEANWFSSGQTTGADGSQKHDLIYYIQKYGKALLAVILGLLFIFGAIFIYREKV